MPVTSKTIGSILHGAYGDYYEQAVCLKSRQLSRPGTRVKLFAAAPHRLAELRVLDFSWADCFEMYTELPNHRIDGFLQFQGRDRELRAEVFPKLTAEVQRQLDSQGNSLPWHHLRSILPLAPEQKLGLSDLGRSMLPDVMRQNGVSPELFNRPTLGFLWRYRSPGGAVKTTFQADAMRLVDKYSCVFRRLIESHGCHILICGMKVSRTKENMRRIDAKYPEYGLDLPPVSSTHLKGLSWALELEILSRCTLCVTNSSGFSEALWIKRGGGVLLVDPPPSYLAKALWHRVSLFNLNRPSSLITAVASRWEEFAHAMISSELDRCLRNAGDRAVTDLQGVAS